MHYNKWILSPIICGIFILNYKTMQNSFILIFIFYVKKNFFGLCVKRNQDCFLSFCSWFLLSPHFLCCDELFGVCVCSLRLFLEPTMESLCQLNTHQQKEVNYREEVTKQEESPWVFVLISLCYRNHFTNRTPADIQLWFSAMSFMWFKKKKLHNFSF